MIPLKIKELGNKAEGNARKSEVAADGVPSILLNHQDGSKKAV
ncbi:MAG: hypothetical protein O3A95_04530 [Planctomycetota bacterium]|nr:hypothetical protein [Planctomycetota bacterium]MDA1113551.1 hypothetical protein [Planctomycetota bacterium]